MYYAFSFNGSESEAYSVHIGFVDSSAQEEGVVLSRSVNNVRQKNTNGFYLMSNVIEEPLDLQIDIVKDGCEDESFEFTYQEMADILSWLTSTDCGELVLHRDNETDAHLYGIFYEITEKNISNHHVGYTAMFKATSPYVFGDTQTTTLGDRRLFTITVPRSYYADKNYLCPILTVTPRESGDLRISCTSWDEDCVITGVTTSENITLDSKNEIFSSDNTQSNATLYRRFNYFFPTLQVNRGSSSSSIVITTNINCDIVVRYTPLILPVGIFN